MVGACAMVVFGVVSPKQIPAAIDFDTLILLLGMMLLAAYLTRAGFFRNAAWRVLKVARTPRMLLVCLAIASGSLSAFLVNDTVCLMLTPLVIGLVESAELPPMPYLLTLSMASNAGSVATFTGNPQNMLIGNLSGQSYGSFAAYMALPAIVATAVVVVTILFMYRKELTDKRFVPATVVPPIDQRLLGLCGVVVVGVVIAFFAGYSMAWSALVGAAIVMALSGKPPRDQMEKVDWVLLVFFASLFIVVFGVSSEGWAEEMRQAFMPLMHGSAFKETAGFSVLTVVGSNLFSNVPYVMLSREWVPKMSDPAMGWQVLALASTLAGNLTLVGSVANLIVFEGARGKVDKPFWAYLKVGVPVTFVSLTLALVVLWAEHAIF